MVLVLRRPIRIVTTALLVVFATSKEKHCGEHVDEPLQHVPLTKLLQLAACTDGNGSNGSGVIEISLNGSSIVSLERCALCRLGSLERLALTDGLLAEAVQLHALPQLESIDLAGNRLSRIGPDAFVDLERLNELDLSRNRLEEIDANALRNFSRLVSVDLSQNRLRRLVALPPSLHFLFAADNRIADLGDVLGNLEKLRVLDLSGNRLTSLHTTTFVALRRLRELRLERNVIAVVESGAFASLEQLVQLSLERNRIDAVPTFYGLEQLRTLQFANNRLANVERDAFQNLSSLETLDLSGNVIASLEGECFRNLENLVQLNLSRNRIPSGEDRVRGYLVFLPSSAFAALKRLVIVDLSRNALGVFGFLHTSGDLLRELRLEQNRIARVRIITADDFVGSLTFVDLSRNVIVRLTQDDVDLGGVVATVKTLDLSCNLIEHVDVDFFARAADLRQLDLSGNRLTTLRLISAMPNAAGGNNAADYNVVVVQLRDNPWLCDCELRWLRSVLESTGEAFLVKDYSQLFCRRSYFRFRERVVQLLRLDSDDDFLCEFHANSSGSDGGGSDCPVPCVCFRTKDRKRVIVDCHNATMRVTPERLPPNTDAVYVDANDIAGVAAFPQTYAGVKTLAANDSRVQAIDADAFATMTSLENLYLQRNELRHLPANVFAALHRLLLLDLSYNFLATIDPLTFQPLTAMTSLSLANNDLSDFAVWTLTSSSDRRLSVVDLSANPWSCECEFAKTFVAWRHGFAGRFVDADRIYCDSAGGDGSELIPLDKFDFAERCSPLLSGQQLVILVSVVCSLLVVVTGGILAFVFRREIQVLIYSRYGVRLFYRSDDDAGGDEDKPFDAFVSYSSVDEEFVVRELLPGLESVPEPPYRLCLHHRDFLVGAFINESIIEAIERSRRTILVLSDNFVRSEWCRFEFRTAHALMLEERRNRVIVVLPGDVPNRLFPEMKHYLRTNTYLSWNDRLFWQKLYFVLPDRSSSATTTTKL